MKNNNQNRRSFLKTSALLGGGLMIHFSGLAKLALENKGAVLEMADQWSEINGYIKITRDNVIKIYNPNPEFGQNVMTSLPMIIAEELDVDWKRVVVEMGAHDSVKLGPQFTGGSNSIRMYWKPLREAGATARQLLMEAAAKAWTVPLEEITTKGGIIFHDRTKKSGTYGEFAHLAVGAPIPKSVKLKNIKDFKIIRTAQKNVEGSKIVSGKPLFGLDYKHEGMLIAMIHHPPGFGMKIKSFNADESLKMPGITDVFQIKLYDEAYAQAGFDTRTFNDLLVIVGRNTWEVMNARKKLVVEWMPAGDIKDMMAGRGEAREVIVPGQL